MAISIKQRADISIITILKISSECSMIYFDAFPEVFC